MGITTLQKSALIAPLREGGLLRWLPHLPLVLVLVLSFVLLPATHSQARGPSQSASSTPLDNSWNNLSSAQQQALGPLAKEWPAMSSDRQKKWLLFADKFQKMTPEDQARTQGKMADWFKLTPEQRLAARENYIRSNKLQPDQRTHKWEEYQQLSEEQKAQLASHEKKKLITNLPTPAESKEKKLQPLKTPKKPVTAAGSASQSATVPVAPAVLPAPVPVVPSTSN